MFNRVLEMRPKSPGQELRFESAAHAVHMFERSKLACKVVSAIALALVLARLALPVTFGGLGEAPFSLTSVVGIAAFAVLMSLVNLWSARVHRDEATDRYATYVATNK
jgi:hypothetical protein